MNYPASSRYVLSSGKARTRDELEFLPAALEIMDTPPNPLGRGLMWVIMLFFITAVVWSVVGRVDIVAVAQGKVIPAGKVKVIQPFEMSTVKAVHVTEDQLVQKGQLLIELDATKQQANITRLQAEDKTISEELQRIRHLLDRLQLLEVSATMPGNERLPLPANDQLSARIDADFRHYRAQLESVQEQINQGLAELKVIQTRVNQLEKTVPLITERTQSYARVLESGAVSRNQWLELEQERIEQSMELQVQREQLQLVKAKIKTTKQNHASLYEQIISDLLKHQNENYTRRDIVEQDIIKAKQSDSLQLIRSPVAGVVQQLAIHTIGGVVTPAQELMRIVPGGMDFEVEAVFNNRDIGFVKEGQRAEVKVDAFPFTRYGTINAEIRSISNDSILDEKNGLGYVARVRLDDNTIQTGDRRVTLHPGLSVSVEAKTGDRRLIDYFLSPLLKFRSESIRER
jgi:hemolysin D